MSSKRKRPLTECDEKISDSEEPPIKRRKIGIDYENENNNEYEKQRNKIIQESKSKIEMLSQEIEKENKRREIALKELDMKYKSTDSPDDSNSNSNSNKLQWPFSKRRINGPPEIDDLRIKLNSHQNAVNNYIEESYVADWSAELYTGEEEPDVDDEDDERVVVAKAAFSVIHCNRLCNHGHSDQLGIVLDAHSQELADLIEVIDCTDDHGIIKCDGGYNDAMNEGGGGDIVYISRVKLTDEKKFKGHGYGKKLIQRICDNQNSFARIILKPYPLQWEHKDIKSDEEKKRYEKDFEKIKSVWESMGFKQIGKSEFWGRSEARYYPMAIVR